MKFFFIAVVLSSRTNFSKKITVKNTFQVALCIEETYLGTSLKNSIQNVDSNFTGQIDISWDKRLKFG